MLLDVRFLDGGVDSKRMLGATAERVVRRLRTSFGTLS